MLYLWTLDEVKSFKIFFGNDVADIDIQRIKLFV